MGYISYQELLKNAKLLALANNTQIQNGKSNKSPAINWEKNPDNYVGIDDNRYGTAIICDYIPKLDLYLNIIDFDKPKTDEDIPLDILRTASMKMIENTYCVNTPSGGLHIYLLSKKQPVKPPKLLNNLNIDFQANYGKGRGKYVVTNYRWDSKGKSKEQYIKRPESPSKIKIIDNVNEILSALITDLEKSGHIKNEVKKHVDRIVEILKPYVVEGSRQDYSCCIAGYLRKQGYKQETVEDIIREVFSGDEEIQARVNNVELTFNKDKNDIKGWSYLKEYLPKKAVEDLLKLTKSNHDDLKSEIIQKLAKHKEPTSKQLFDYVTLHLDLYVDLDILKYYEKTIDGSFVEINEKRIIEFCIEEFGSRAISRKRCIEVLKHIVNPIEHDYELLEFTNGILNTETQEFFEDKTQFAKIPKLNLPFKWNSDAKGEKIEKLISEILINSDYPNDLTLWLRAVGHAFMSYNRIGKITLLQGPPGTGKSTLLELLKRVLPYSSLSTSVINANERFTLYPMVNKCINIDDDINNGLLKAIGNLNTITTGNGLEVEIKGENKSVVAINPQIPRLFGAGNTLPPVLGDGFSRRLLLIHCKNVVDYNKRDENLHNDILVGKCDENLEWFVYTAINTYWKHINEPITSKKTEEQMKEDYEFQSDPLKKAIEQLFEENFGDEKFIEVNKVNHYVKKWCIYAYKQGKISKEHLKPSNTQIRKAMDRAGFNQKLDHYVDEYENRKSMKVYEDIETTKVLKMVLGYS